MNAKMIKEIKEEAYEQGLNDAWELALKFSKMDDSEREKIFDCSNDTFFFDKEWMTPQEALAKLKASEEAQEQARFEEEMKRIKVGSVVIWSGVKAVVMDEDGVGNVALFTENGCIEDWIDLKNVTNTGKHIDIQQLLDSIGE